MKPIFKYFLFASALPLIASCSSDEPGPEALPEGKYPMEFALSIAPQSRVSTTDDAMGCQWSDGDEITITVTQNGQKQTATATLDADGNITACTPTLYWTSTAAADVKAIYHNISSAKYASQTEGLAYAMKATATAQFGQRILLNMEHQLAQVRLKISGYKPDGYGLAKFRGYIDYTLDDEDGFTTNVNSGRGYITMYYDAESGSYVANVALGRITNDGLSLFKFDNGSEDVYEYDYDIQAGQVYTFDLESVKPAFTINGYEAVLMRRASGTPGTADYVPALYFATCNLGADTPYEAGKYFWWGDTEGFDPNTQSVPSGTIIQYDTPEKYYSNDMLTSAEIADNDIGIGVLTPEYDAAAKQLGSPWRMMTYDDVQWLKDNTTKTYCPVDEEAGHLASIMFTSNDTGNSIIMPLTGWWNGNGISSFNLRSLYRTSQMRRWFNEVQIGVYEPDYYTSCMNIYCRPESPTNISFSIFMDSQSAYDPIRPVASF